MSEYDNGAFKGMCSNQAWQFVLSKETKMTDMEDRMELYKTLYKKLLEVNIELLEKNKIPEATISAGGSTPIPQFEKKNFGSNDERGLGIEVGAAWIDRKDKNKLSCKDKETGAWSNIVISEMSKTSDGYEHNGFIFREIKERKNDKMPNYRVYKEEKE